jgi:PncC family amidohydrolase
MNQSYAAVVGELLRQHRLSLAIAESCTGGLLGDKITNVPGASNYFMGGVIAYDNRVKVGLLSVREGALEQFGAVSEEIALEMAQGARQAMQADIGLSITGIAGPSGGTPEKPVGLTWIGMSAAGAQKAWRSIWPGDRQAVKEQSADEALRRLAEFLQAT